MRVIYTVCEILAMLLVFFQIIWPGIRGRPWFPMFRRRKQAAIIDEIAEVRADADEQEAEQVLNDLKAKVHPPEEQHEEVKPPNGRIF